MYFGNFYTVINCEIKPINQIAQYTETCTSAHSVNPLLVQSSLNLHRFWDILQARNHQVYHENPNLYSSRNDDLPQAEHPILHLLSQ